MPTQYSVRSVVRARHNRTARAALPQKPRRKQYVGEGQLRLAHGRALIITEDQLKANLVELREKQAAHILEVRTLDGRLVDLMTLEVAPGAAGAATAPNFPLDSANNDKNFPGIPGHLLSRGGGDELTVPQILKDNEKPSLFQDAAAQADDAVDAPASSPEFDIDALVDEAQTGDTAPATTEEVSSDKKGGSSRKRNR